MKRLLKKLVPKIFFDFYYLFLAYSGMVFYRFPSLNLAIIGVLGTRGKTTTANFIWSCLTAAGYKTGLTSTANIRIGEKEIMNPYHMTMPGRFTLQKLIHQFKKAGCQFAIIETPSEGIEQWRHLGIAYDAAVLTTLYPEYLEAHNWDYERCKAMNQKIFGDLANQPRKNIAGKDIPKIIAVNIDSPDAASFLNFAADKKISYSLQNPAADFFAEKIQQDEKGISFLANSTAYRLNLLGRFNVYNALAAIAVLSSLGVSPEKIRNGLINLTGVPGRMEKIDYGQKFSLFVDYAHDPTSLKAALVAVKEMNKNLGSKIIILLGAEGGGRDIKKRPVMGDLAANLADIVIVSNVDPYNDDPKKILNDIAAAAERAGKVNGENLFVIEDRRQGIQKAVELASSGDIILITGKGAEQSIIIGDKKIPWDDRRVVQEILNRHNPI
jgi:UDP-N-acetylmuramoyl-L-alanyl-D-glutamate--2,6-diaminopimelate ligase